MRIAPLLLILAFVPTAQAMTPAGRSGPDCKGVKPICDSLVIKDPVQRDLELTHAIETGLWSDDQGVRKNTLFFLDEHSHEVDPRRFRRAIEHFDELDEYRRGAAVLADADLYYAPRDERKRVYQRAIVEGEVALGTVEKLSRFRGIELAAREGFGELQKLIQDYYPKLSPDERSAGRLPWDRVEALLELHDGAENEKDGNQRAASRLEAMDVRVLAEKLEKSESYRGVVGDVAKLACRDRESKECGTLGRIFKKQSELLSADFQRHYSERKQGVRTPTELDAPQRTAWMRGILQEVPPDSDR